MGDIEQDILDLVAARKKIEAIKLVRQHLGMGLAEAKAFVEELQFGGPAATAPRPWKRPEPKPPGDGFARSAPVGSAPDQDPFDPQLDNLLRAHKKLDAVKLYRERMGGDLKDAKDAIELRAVEIGLQSRPSKCFIATAAYGGGEQAEVMALRRFRNRVLKRAWWGRPIIACYETLSPPLALLVLRSPTAAAAVRAALHPLARAAARAPGRGQRTAEDAESRGVKTEE